MSEGDQLNGKLAFAAREGPPQGIITAPPSMGGATKPVVKETTFSKANKKVRNTLPLPFQ